MSDPDKEARSAYNRRHHQKRKADGRHAVYMRGYYQKRRMRLVELKANRACLRCGYDDPRALTFHHRDPAEKEFSIALKAWCVSMERLLSEVAKCDLLCANCHLIEHYNDALPNGGSRRYANGQDMPDPERTE